MCISMCKGLKVHVVGVSLTFQKSPPGLGDVRMMKMGLFELGIYRLSGAGKRGPIKRGRWHIFLWKFSNHYIY